jgi:DNA polymerase-1
MRLRDYSERQQQLGRVVYSMERTGVPISLEVCREIEAEATFDAAQTRSTLDALAGVLCGRTETNWGYWKWLAEFLHGPAPHGLGLPESPFWKKGLVKEGEVKTDDRALEWLGWKFPHHRPLLGLIREWRRQSRMVVYARSWQELAVFHSEDGTWRLHPSFGMSSDADDRPGAKTGRFGIKNPPLQQVPHDKKKDPYRLRRAFIAPPGKLLVIADYSQLEIVVLAHLCYRLFGATALRDSISPGAPDLHSATAKYVFGKVLGNLDILNADVDTIKGSPSLSWRRDKIKEVRYGLNYRKGAWGFGNTLFDVEGNALGEATAQTMVDALCQMHPEIVQFQGWVDDYIYRHLGMWSLEGRWGPFADGNSSTEWARKRAQRQASNWPMQAGAQEIVLAAMIALLEAGYEQTLQVHDEIHILVDEDKADAACGNVEEIMEHTTPLDAPLKAVPHAATNWEDGK